MARGSGDPAAGVDLLRRHAEMSLVAQLATGLEIGLGGRGTMIYLLLIIPHLVGIAGLPGLRSPFKPVERQQRVSRRILRPGWGANATVDAPALRPPEDRRAGHGRFRRDAVASRSRAPFRIAPAPTTTRAPHPPAQPGSKRRKSGRKLRRRPGATSRLIGATRPRPHVALAVVDKQQSAHGFTGVSFVALGRSVSALWGAPPQRRQPPRRASLKPVHVPDWRCCAWKGEADRSDGGRARQSPRQTRLRELLTAHNRGDPFPALT